MKEKEKVEAVHFVSNLFSLKELCNNTAIIGLFCSNLFHSDLIVEYNSMFKIIANGSSHDLKRNKQRDSHPT